MIGMPKRREAVNTLGGFLLFLFVAFFAIAVNIAVLAGSVYAVVWVLQQTGVL